jgi:opacity protein-like surface antigen
LIKRLVLVAALISASMAQAVEVGVTDGNNFTKQENVWGVTVGTQVKGFGLTGGFARNGSSDTFSVLGSKDVAKVGPASVAVKAGVAYVDNKVNSDGYALIVGAGASMPIAKKVAATLDYSYQAGESKVSSQDGNRLTAGLKYSF